MWSFVVRYREFICVLQIKVLSVYVELKLCKLFVDDVLCEVTEADIPQTLIERLAEERSEHTIKKMRYTISMYNCTPRNKIYSNYKTCTFIFLGGWKLRREKSGQRLIYTWQYKLCQMTISMDIKEMICLIQIEWIIGHLKWKSRVVYQNSWILLLRIWYVLVSIN